ncbi:MAG: hypothetical protein ACQGQO_04750 [Sphaerochaetaceae bacterium]
MTEEEKKMQDELTEWMKDNHRPSFDNPISLEALKGIKFSGWVDSERIDAVITNFQMYTIMYFLKHKMLARPSRYVKELEEHLKNGKDLDKMVKDGLESKLLTCMKCEKFRTADCLLSADSRNDKDIPNPMYTCCKFKKIKANK